MSQISINLKLKPLIGGLIVLITFTFISKKALPQEEKKKAAVKIYEEQINPHRVFLVPTGDVLGSLELNISGGSVIGEMRDEKRPFLGRISMGLGNVAEVELSTSGIISGLKEGSPAIPTVAFKLQFLPERNKFPFISLAGALRSSPTWHGEIRDTVDFQKRLATLYFVGSKTFGNIGTHIGVSINDLRIRTLHTHSDQIISPTSERGFVNKNIFSPFAAITVRVNPRTFLMAEWEMIPKYNFEEDNPEVSGENIKTEWMTIAGVRFYVFDWLPLDVGVLYRSDYYGIGDTHIHASFNVNLPLPKMISKIRSD